MRELIGDMTPKFGCGQGGCGTCSVLRWWLCMKLNPFHHAIPLGTFPSPLFFSFFLFSFLSPFSLAFFPLPPLLFTLFPLLLLSFPFPPDYFPLLLLPPLLFSLLFFPS
ncbi:hypothetical protein ACQJ2U_26760, partial [Klebsiella pneumoniae]